MSKFTWGVLCLFVCAGAAFASTPDGMTPAEESICSMEVGAAYGLCVAACEAKDCGDPNQSASQRACDVNARNFERKTGRPLPCMATCPCPEVAQLVADIDSGSTQVQQCTAGTTFLSVTTEDGDFVLISDGMPSICSLNGMPPFTELTPVERLVCRATLRRVIEQAGVACGSPE